MDVKQILANSLEELMQTKSIDDVHVNDIIQYAGLSRPTFYNHFLGKYDLLNWKYNNILISTVYPIVEGLSYTQALLTLFDVYETKWRFFRNGFISSDMSGLRYYNVTISKDVLIRMFEGKGVDTTEPAIRAMLDVFVWGSTYVLTQWILERMKTPKKDVANLFKRSWPKELAAYIE